MSVSVKYTERNVNSLYVHTVLIKPTVIQLLPDAAFPPLSLCTAARLSSDIVIVTRCAPHSFMHINTPHMHTDVRRRTTKLFISITP